MTRLWTVSFALVLTAGLATTNAASAAAMIDTSTANAPEGTKTAKVRSLDVALDYPANWTVFAFDAKGIAATRKVRVLHRWQA